MQESEPPSVTVFTGEPMAKSIACGLITGKVEMKFDSYELPGTIQFPFGPVAVTAPGVPCGPCEKLALYGPEVPQAVVTEYW